MRLALGHDGPPRQYWRENLVTGEPLERCPMRTIQLLGESDPSLVAEVEGVRTQLYPLFRRGYLPRSGGVEDQAARTLALLVMLDEMKQLAQVKAEQLMTPDDGGGEI